MNRNKLANGSDAKRQNAEDTTGCPPRGAAAPVALGHWTIMEAIRLRMLTGVSDRRHP
jgi:hypothetical protein